MPATLLKIWRDPDWRGRIVQLLTLLGVLLFVLWIADNVSSNLARQNVATGFGFLDDAAGFGINQTLVDYSETSSYGRVFLVGLLNTLLVAVVGIVLATVLGFLVGIGRLSSNWLIARLSAIYVETLRNIPLLLQIFFWYFGVLKQLPLPRQSWTPVDGVFINIRGTYLPKPIAEDGFGLVLTVFALAVVGAILLTRWAHKRQAETGQIFPTGWVTAGLIIGLPLLAYFVMGAPMGLEMPQASRFNIRGGIQISPELVALVLALSIYTASFIAEIVRAGIQAVPKGQDEAAAALGLHYGTRLRLVIIPQAMRVIIPPLTSQYLNLTKNSSLAVAIAYPDLVSVFAGTALNQTGQAVEILALTMAVYLTISLATALFMNWFNARMALAER